MKFFAALLLAILTLQSPLALHGQSTPPAKPSIENVIYGRKHGMALTMDVFVPEKPNGKAVVYLLSGGWSSSRDFLNAVPWKQQYPGLIKRGYTVFTAVHGSQPKFTIPEMIPDVQRAVRYVRRHAATYKVDPKKIGLMGASAGGHLSLSAATMTHLAPAATDDVDKESSAVQAVVAFYPPTDFLNYGNPGEDGVGAGRLKFLAAVFGPRAATAEGRAQLGREISPIYFLSAQSPPALLIHGDKDNLVPYQQAQAFEEKAKELKVPVKVINHPGAGHGWPDYTSDVEAAADWFDQYLK